MADEQERERSEQSSQQRWNHDLTRALVGGLVTLAVGGGTIGLLGSTNFYEARRLVESLAEVLPYLGSAGIAASTTVLALMVTLLGISARAEARLSRAFYRRILWIGRQATVLFAACVLLLLLLAAPLGEADSASTTRTLVIAQFYVSAGIVAVVAGIFVSMITMLQTTVGDLVLVLGMRRSDHPLLADDDSGEG